MRSRLRTAAALVLVSALLASSGAHADFNQHDARSIVGGELAEPGIAAPAEAIGAHDDGDQQRCRECGASRQESSAPIAPCARRESLGDDAPDQDGGSFPRIVRRRGGRRHT